MSNKKRILLVDDDQIDIMALSQSIKEQFSSVEIDVANNGVEALKHLQSVSEGAGGPDLVLLDINMPMMDGFELLDELRKDEKLKKLVVFMLSTSQHETDRSKAYSRGVAGYFVKNKMGPGYDDLATLLEKYLSLVEKAA